MHGGLSLPVPEDVLEAIAERAAAIAVAQLREELAEARGASQWMTTAEAARYLRCEPQRIYELHSSGALPAHREGGRLLFAVSDLERRVVPPAFAA